MISVEKPGSPEEILEHFGKKGMRWGVRSQRGQAIATGRETGRAAAKEAARSGAGRVEARTAGRKAGQAAAKAAAKSSPKKSWGGIGPTKGSREFRRQNPTASLQAATIHNARRESHARTKAIHAEKDPAKRAKLLEEHRNNPGTAAALRLTRGEKVAVAVLSVPLPFTALAVSGVVRVKRAQVS